MTLAPQQIELLLYLIVALIIGFIFGYFLSRAIARERYEPEIEGLFKTLDNRDDKIEASSAKFRQLEQHMATTINELEIAKKSSTDMQDAVMRYKKSITTLSDDKKTLEDSLLEKDNYIIKLDEKLKDVNNEIEKEKDFVVELKNINENQKKKIEEIEQEIEKNIGLKQKFEELEVELDNSNKTNMQLQSRVDKISSSAEKNRAMIIKLDAKNVDSNEFKIKNSALMRDFDKTKADLVRLQNEINDKDKALKETSEKLCASQEELFNIKTNPSVREEIKSSSLVSNSDIEDVGKLKKGFSFGDLALVKLVQNKFNHNEKEDTPPSLVDSKRSDKLLLFKSDVLKNYGSVDLNLLESIMINLEPSIYDENFELVDYENRDELEKIREDFLKKVLELKESDEDLDKSIVKSCEKITNAKEIYRVTLYYILVKHYSKETFLNKA